MYQKPRVRSRAWLTHSENILLPETKGPTIVVQLCLSTPFREEMATGSNNSSTSVAMGHEMKTKAPSLDKALML